MQKFIGNSQNGLHSLETRVHGLEMALDEISRNLALSAGRIANNDSAANTCCRLPGAEFLSAKFWRRTEGRSSSRFTSEVQNLAEMETRGSHKWDKRRLGVEGGLVVNPLAEIIPQSSASPEATPIKMLKSATRENAITHAYQLK